MSIPRALLPDDIARLTTGHLLLGRKLSLRDERSQQGQLLALRATAALIGRQLAGGDDAGAVALFANELHDGAP